MTPFFVLLLAAHGVTASPEVTQADQRAIQQIVDAGRCADVSESPDQRVRPPQWIAPGAPPLLSFRYYEGKQHRRFGNVDLMLDDAGH